VWFDPEFHTLAGYQADVTVCRSQAEMFTLSAQTRGRLNRFSDDLSQFLAQNIFFYTF